MIRFGFESEWLLDLDLVSFNSLADSAMRTWHNERMEAARLARCIQHAEAKDWKKEWKSLQKLAGKAPVLTGDDLAKALGQEVNR